MTYHYKHEGKRVWMSCDNGSTQLRIVSCGEELTLQLLYETACKCQSCSGSQETLHLLTNKHPGEIVWKNEAEYVISVMKRSSQENWDEESEISMALILAEYFGADRFDIWPD